jgi:hypothetical protein
LSAINNSCFGRAFARESSIRSELQITQIAMLVGHFQGRIDWDWALIGPRDKYFALEGWLS